MTMPDPVIIGWENSMYKLWYIMYENGKMRPVETILRKWERDKGE
jgi:hypothetical protein